MDYNLADYLKKGLYSKHPKATVAIGIAGLALILAGEPTGATTLEQKTESQTPNQPSNVLVAKNVSSCPPPYLQIEPYEKFRKRIEQLKKSGWRPYVNVRSSSRNSSNGGDLVDEILKNLRKGNPNCEYTATLGYDEERGDTLEGAFTVWEREKPKDSGGRNPIKSKKPKT